jgi:DNA-binding MarR family transcriptional regulator
MSSAYSGQRFEKSQVAQLTVTQWKVLLVLTYYGEENVYQVAKKYKMAYPAVHRAIRGLRELGWVKVVRNETNAKNVKSIRYGLTDEGLLWLFARRPREVPPAVTDESRKEVTVEHERMGGTANHENAKQESEVSDQVINITTNEDVHMHLLFKLDIDTIAEMNIELFPVVFGPWKIHQESSMSGLIKFFLPEIAFSTLVEIHYDYQGLLKKHESLDQVFAYKIYRKVIEISAQTEPDKNIESGVECAKRVWKWMHDVATVCPKALDLYKEIASELHKGFSCSLSFMDDILERIGHDNGVR